MAKEDCISNEGPPDSYIRNKIREKVGSFLFDCSSIETDNLYKLSERFHRYIRKTMRWVEMSSKRAAKFDEFTRGQRRRSKLELLIIFMEGIEIKNLNF